MDKKKSGQDEYLSIDKYGGRPGSTEHKGFASFEHGGEHYFAMLNKAGGPMLRSEGYASAKGRDNGIESVKKNRGNKDRWSVKEAGGKFFLILKAGNNQEIGRSGSFSSQADAEAALKGYQSSGKGWGALAGGAAAAAGMAAGGGGPVKNDNVDAGNKGSNKASKNVLQEEDKEDDYLPTKEYEGHPVNDKKNNVALFKHDNGQYYFALMNKDGSVKLRSEGFETAKNRDSELGSVLKYHNDDKMYQTLERGKFYMMVLKDENGREVGRSPLLKKGAGSTSSKKEEKSTKSTKSSKSSGAASGIVAGGAALGAGKIISETRNVIGEKRNVIGEKRNFTGKEKRNVINEKRNVLSESKSKIKEDDYLKCEAYKGHKITDSKNRVAKFKGKDGQFYFAVYNKDGSVRLRSEGFKTEAGREDELKHCIKNMETEKMYSTIKRGKYFINVLKDGTGREVARSCMSKEVQRLVTPPPPPPPPVKKVVKQVVKKAAPVVTPVAAAAPVAEAAATTSGCLKFWPLLLLLLIPLLWFLLKGCGAAAPVVVPPPPPPPPPVKVVTPPPPPPTCDCSLLTHPVFKMPNGPATKTTDRLGRAPEYGNSHALSPEQFYNKLKSKYAGSAAERIFLDGIFKQMGYKNGFKDATAGLFTAVNVPRGVSGNLGTKTTHKTVYRKLDPTDAKDLKAFRIKSANHCDLHFMKTCGNHFFFNECK